MFEEVDNKEPQPQAAPQPTAPAVPAQPAKPASADGKEEIHTMPMDYYMGEKTKQSVKGSQAAPQPQAMKPMAPQTTSSEGGGKKKMLNIIIVVVLVLVVGISGYLLYASFQGPTPDPTPVPVVVPVVEEPEVVVDEDEAPEVEVDEDEAPPVEIEDETVMFDPSQLNKVSLSLLASKDTDKDGLTDLEEEIIGTNINLNDTDGDTYRDAEELKNYYSPLQAGGVSLTEMNFVETYENELMGYKILYPKAWLISPLDEKNPTDVMITSDGNEFINILMNKKVSTQTLEEWYLEKAPDVSATELKKYKNHADLALIESPDAFTVYVDRGEEVYIINYNIGLNEEASYPGLFGVIVNSFELTEKKTPAAVPSLSSLESFLNLSAIDINEDSVVVSGSCSDIECWSEKVLDCDEAKINIAFTESLTYEMNIKGQEGGACSYESRFVKHPNVDFVNQLMTCNYGLGEPLDLIFLEASCDGALFGLISE